MIDLKEDLTKEEQDALYEKLDDPVWRLNNLYSITNKDGKEIPFVPTN